jgi:hypothetical protein
LSIIDLTFSTFSSIVGKFVGYFIIDIFKRFYTKEMFLFSDVYSLCVAYPEPLADKLYSETKKFLEEHVAATLVKVKAGGEQNLLANYHETWEEFSRGIDYLHMLYSYLNNQHIRKQKISEAELNYGSLVIDHSETMKEIGELGLDIWRRQMIDPLKDELVRLLLDGIRFVKILKTMAIKAPSFACANFM